MFKLTLRCPGQGVLWVSTNGTLLKKGSPDMPVRVPRGDDAVTIELDPSGNTLSFVSYSEKRNENGRVVYGHSGAASLPLSELNKSTLELGIDHRGLTGPGALVDIIAADMDITLYPPIPQILFNPRQYLNALYANERGVNFELADALRAPWWVPAEMNRPLPFAAFISGYNLVPYSAKYLNQLLQLGASRMGLTYDEAQEVSAAAADDQMINWESSTGRRARELIWHVLSTIPNSFQYETDYMVFANGTTELVESFDLLWQRGCGDCEDMGTAAHKIARAFQNTPGTGDFGRLIQRFVPTSLLGTVTQPSAGTGVRGEEDESKYGGHLWFAMLPRREVEQIRAGNPARLKEGIVVIEGTGVAFGLPTLTPADQSRIDAHKRMVSLNPRLGNVPHEIPIVSPYTRHSSLFYRGVVRIQFEVEPTVFTSRDGPDKVVYWTQGASVVDLQRGFRGVSWEDFLEGRVLFDEYKADTADVIMQSVLAMEQLVPEPTPPEMPYLPQPVPTIEGRQPAVFYIPQDMQMGNIGSKAEPMKMAQGIQVQVEHENLGFGQIMTRLAFI